MKERRAHIALRCIDKALHNLAFAMHIQDKMRLVSLTACAGVVSRRYIGEMKIENG